MITDSHGSYFGLGSNHAAHEIVNHSGDEYVRDKVFHTNTIEGAFSLLKRSIIGIYHQVTPKHLLRYCDESAFRYNSRKLKDAERFSLSLRNVEGGPTYKDLVNKGIPVYPVNISQPITDENKGVQRAVVQLQDGVIINQFEGINDAARQTGITRILILRVLKGQRKSAHDFEWKYL